VNSADREGIPRPRGAGRPSPGPGLAVALGVFSLLTAVFALPVLRDPAHLVFRSLTRDDIGDLWFLWWVKDAVAGGKDVFHTSWLYYPWGTSLAFTEFSPLYGFLSLPLLLARDSPEALVLAHNVWVLATFVLTGLFTFLLARSESGSGWGGLLAGMLVAFSAFRFYHLEHLNLLSVYWIPLTAWMTGRWAFPESNTTRGAVARGHLPGAWWWLGGMAGCGLGLAASSTTLLLAAALLLIPWAVLRTVERGEIRNARVWTSLGAAAAAFGAGTLPVVGRWIAGAMRGVAPAASPGQLDRYGPDLVGFLLPERSLVLGSWMARLGVPHHGPGGGEMFLGWTGLVLAVIGSLRYRRRALPWLIPAVLAFLLCLGPTVWIAGRRLPLPVSAFSLVAHLVPPLRAVRTPERFVVIVLLGLAVLAALGLRRVLEIRGGRIVAGAAFVVMLIELFPSMPPPERVEASPVYARMAADPLPGAVFELSPVYFKRMDFMFHVAITRRPLVGDPLSRPPSDTRSLARELDMSERLSSPSTACAALRDLETAGIRFVICHRDGMPEEAWNGMLKSYGRCSELWDREPGLAVFLLGP